MSRVYSAFTQSNKADPAGPGRASAAGVHDAQRLHAQNVSAMYAEATTNRCPEQATIFNHPK
jgi:hypothetical protein